MILLSFDVGIKNLAYCIIYFSDEGDWTILDWVKINCIPDKRYKYISENDAIGNIIKCLDELNVIDSIDTILIERQPPCNYKMRNISNYILMYYKIHSIMFNKNINILLYSAKNKLKNVSYNTGNYSKNNYYRNKKLAIDYCKSILPEQWLKFINKNKKKDDLADSFLQGISYIDLVTCARSKQTAPHLLKM